MTFEDAQKSAKKTAAPRWFIPLGVVLVILGAVGLALTGFVTLGSVLAFGVLLLVAGGVQLVQSFECKDWKSLLPHLGIAVLYVLGGAIVLYDPIGSTIALTLLLGVFILAGGLLRLFIGFQSRGERGWGWIVLSGALGVILGGLIIFQWPAGSFWIIGLFVAIELIFQGWSMFLLGLGFRDASVSQDHDKEATAK